MVVGIDGGPDAWMGAGSRRGRILFDEQLGGQSPGSRLVSRAKSRREKVRRLHREKGGPPSNCGEWAYL
jgi:hypothetical protein